MDLSKIDSDHGSQIASDFKGCLLSKSRLERKKTQNFSLILLRIILACGDNVY